MTGRRRAAVSSLAPIAKAVAGSLAAGVTATIAGFGAALADGDITRPEAYVALGLGLTAFAAGGGFVYAAPANRPA